MPSSSYDTPSQTSPTGPPLQSDVLVVGGGVNGAGIARDLAGRGVRVVLCEQDDLAQHTSSASTKLIHGGLRYLEYREFGLVRKALAEREGLLRSAPHIMWPLRFVMPHAPEMRPAWMIRAGLFLYDHLAKRRLLPGSRTIDLRRHPAGAALKPRYTKGFVYSDGWVDDARLVVLSAVDAAERGAIVLTRTRCAEVRRSASGWKATLEPRHGAPVTVEARALVNAAGPWTEEFLTRTAHAPSRSLRLVKGSHIVVRQLFSHDHAYIFQSPDKRIVFAIPYEGRFTLIGTTEVDHHGPLGAPQIGLDETRYLCAQASRYFAAPVTPADVVWSYSGVRPLLDDASSGVAAAVTRDYLLALETEGGAPLLSVWGGKITTFRRLAEEAADRLAGPLGLARGAWTAGSLLPGGDLSAFIGPRDRPSTDVLDDARRFDAAVAARWADLPGALRRRWVRLYGSRIDRLLSAPGPALPQLGPEVAPGLHAAELAYLHRDEWARSGDDVLWRRTKLGLHLTPEERATVDRWCATHWPDADADTGPSANANAVTGPSAATPAPEEAPWS